MTERSDLRAALGVRDELAVGALARALVRTGMYVDAGIDTSAGLDNPRTYAAAILSDPDLAADGLHFVMVETLDRVEQAAEFARPAVPAALDDHAEDCASRLGDWACDCRPAVPAALDEVRWRQIEDLARELVTGWRDGYPMEDERSADEVIGRLEDALDRTPGEYAALRSEEPTE